ncbi:MAG TPA: YciI family protein [Terracidiphilus sp.]|nr:YciI family protein [Terracidiphilus sp.]
MKFARFALALALPLAMLGSVSAPAQSPTAPSAVTPAQPLKTWFIRLIPPRTTFITDMTADEKKAMEDHFAYWKAEFAKGVCIFGGPVLDPKGVYGVLAIRAATEDDARAIAMADPSVQAGINKIEIAEIKVAFLGQATDPAKAQ